MKTLIQMNNDLFKQLEQDLIQMDSHLIDKHTKIPNSDRTPEFEKMLKQFQWVKNHFYEFKTEFINVQQKER